VIELRGLQGLRGFVERMTCEESGFTRKSTKWHLAPAVGLKQTLQTPQTLQPDVAGSSPSTSTQPPAPSDFVTALVMLLSARARRWSGSAAELHALMPGHAADPTRLAKALTQAADDLAEAGITIERKRQPGTGARIIVLTRQVEQPSSVAAVTAGHPASAATAEAARDPVTLPALIATVTLPPGIAHAVATLNQPGRPLLACPICRSSDWAWHQSARRRASRWVCSTCNPQP
jgi:hypothetical protein